MTTLRSEIHRKYFDNVHKNIFSYIIFFCSFVRDDSVLGNLMVESETVPQNATVKIPVVYHKKLT